MDDVEEFAVENGVENFYFLFLFLKEKTSSPVRTTESFKEMLKSFIVCKNSHLLSTKNCPILHLLRRFDSFEKQFSSIQSVVTRFKISYSDSKIYRLYYSKSFLIQDKKTTKNGPASVPDQ